LVVAFPFSKSNPKFSKAISAGPQTDMHLQMQKEPWV
jgi:hypothetical protein